MTPNCCPLNLLPLFSSFISISCQYSYVKHNLKYLPIYHIICIFLKKAFYDAFKFILSDFVAFAYSTFYNVVRRFAYFIFHNIVAKFAQFMFSRNVLTIVVIRNILLIYTISHRLYYFFNFHCKKNMNNNKNCANSAHIYVFPPVDIIAREQMYWWENNSRRTSPTPPVGYSTSIEISTLKWPRR